MVGIIGFHLMKLIEWISISLKNKTLKNSPETLKKRRELKAKWKKEIDPATVPKTIKQICKDCGELKECHWNYAFSSKGKPEYRPRCIECHKIYATKIQRRNQHHITERALRQRYERKKKAVDYLGGKCSICGYNKFLAALTFHHNGGEEKERDISRMLDWSWEKLKQELDKCDLLCFNCHMELHWDNNGDVEGNALD